MPKKLITHSEEFHTDDVFATALLLELFPDANVVRSRDEAVIATGDIVYDVGKVYDPAMGRFDHHQAQAGRRTNGIIYSAFGLLWKEYGVLFCNGDEEVARKIDQTLVAPIDAHDNGQGISQAVIAADVQPYTIDNIIGMLNPLGWNGASEEYDTQFMEAVALAQRILRRMRASVADKRASQGALLDAYDKAGDKRVVLMEKQAAANEIIEQLPELLYLISPRPNGSWGVLAVSVAPGSFTCRKAFPKSWRGQPADKLPGITNVPDAIFCHNTGFYAVAQSKEGAVALAKEALAA